MPTLAKNSLPQPRTLIPALVIIFAAFALIVFSLGLDLNNRLVIFGPIISLSAALVLVFRRRAIIPLFFFAFIFQFFCKWHHDQIFLIANWIEFFLLAVVFCLQSWVTSTAILRVEGLYRGYYYKEALGLLIISIFTSLIGCALAIFCVSFFTAIPVSEIKKILPLGVIGQYIGLIVSIPLVRGLFLRQDLHMKAHLKSVALPLWVMFGFIYLFLGLLNTEIEKKIQIEFEKVAIEASTLVEAEFLEQDAFIEGIQSFFTTHATAVNAEEFKSYVSPALVRYPMIQGISWLPYLKASQIPEFIQSQRKIYPNYEIRAIGGTTTVSTESKQTFFAPVAYIQPLITNQKALGFDIASNPARLVALEQAKSGFKTIATAPIKLVQTQDQKMGILLIKYVAGSRNGPGFISEVLRLEEFIGLTTAALREYVTIRVVDADSKSVIFNNDFSTSNLTISKPIIFGGRVFDVDMSPTAEFVDTHTPYKYKILLGIFAALIMSISNSFLLLVSGFQRKIEDQVTQKTAELQKSEQQLQYVLSATGDGIWDWDMQSGTVIHNDRWLELLGLDTQNKESTVDSYKNRIYLEDREKVSQSIENSIKTGEKYSLEYRMQRADGSLIWVSDIGMVVERAIDGEPLRMVGAITDITSQKSDQAMIEELAFFDPVTNLPNRRYIKDRIQRAIGESARNDSFSALMFMDLDNFKFVNDTYGHHYGDVLLKQFGARLIDVLRPLDVVSRIGGDEFLVLFDKNYPSLEQCKEVLHGVIERVSTKLADPFQLDQNINLSIKPSIGVVIFGKDTNGFEEVMKFADLAMYNNKLNPDEVYRLFDHSLHEEFLHMSEMNTGLIEACAQEQFYVEYQPVLNRNKELVAHEALARWRHPRLGKVMPHIFIPFAEKNGHIRSVSDVIFKQIFSSMQLREMLIHKPDYSIMVNLSGLHLMDEDFSQDFVALANSYSFPLNKVHLEVTEGVFMDDKDKAIRTMDSLKIEGIKFAMDDFGTGYSSLSYLQKLPINYLKIDKSFVSGMQAAEGDMMIVKNIIMLAHTLGLEVIAEGVETEVQFNLLSDMGCNYFQGWFCGRPGPLPNL